MIKNSLDCREKRNKSKFSCRLKTVCNRRDNSILTIGKTAFSFVNPSAGIAIASYDIGKSALCNLQSRKKKWQYIEKSRG